MVGSVAITGFHTEFLVGVGKMMHIEPCPLVGGGGGGGGGGGNAPPENF